MRVGGKTPTDEDVFSPTRQVPCSPFDLRQAPAGLAQACSRDGDLGEQPTFYARAIDEEPTRPPADWLVVTRATTPPSPPTPRRLSLDNANGWYDAARQFLHLVVPTQSPQEVAQRCCLLAGQQLIWA